MTPKITQHRVDIGMPFQINVHAEAGHRVIPALSGLAAHLRIPPFGILGLDPASMVTLQPIQVHQTRTVVLRFQIPASAALQGQFIRTQAFDLNLDNLGSSHLTNWIVDEIR